MAADDKLAQLNRQLSRQSLGPIGSVSNRIVASSISVVTSLVTWLRQSAFDQPLITLLMAFQAGYAVGRLGRRYARH